MKNRILLITTFIVASATLALGQAGIEQYYYWQEKEAFTFVPVVHIQSRSNWYGEARCNYEDQGTFSLYAGRNFSKEHKRFSYSLTPIVGGVFGSWNGGSVGLNAALESGNMFFSSQSQYTFSPAQNDSDFLFSWLELGYEPVKWFYFGFSVQHTRYTRQNLTLLEHGAMIGFTAGKWSFPIYGFNLMDPGRYFVLGINLGIGLKNTDR